MHGSSFRIAPLVCPALARAAPPLAAQKHLASIRGVVVGAALAGASQVEVRATREGIDYDLPDAQFGSPTFGRILSAGSPRRVQLGVRTEF